MKYNTELVNELIKYIEAGNYAKTACEAIRISEKTYYQWLKQKSKFSKSIKRA